MDQDEYWMRQALAMARRAEQSGEVPVGAVLVAEAQVLGAGYNRVIQDADPTAHAEIVAMRQAARRVGNYRLPGTTLYVTLEPCSMCAGAIVLARIQRVVFATHDPRTGAAVSLFRILDDERLNHRCELTTGVCQAEAAGMLRAFFRRKRTAKRPKPMS